MILERIQTINSYNLQQEIRYEVHESKDAVAGPNIQELERRQYICS